MYRSSFSLVLLVALFAFAKNAEGQSSRITQVKPALNAQLGLEADGDEESELDLSDPNDQDDALMDEDSDFGLEDDVDSELDDDLEDDLDSDLDDDLLEGLDDEGEPIKPQRLSDDDIRSGWPRHSMANISLSLAESGRVPDDRSELLQEFGRVSPVSDTTKLFGWEAPSIRYQPLYFEDVALERYGQTLPDYRQSVRSAIHFGKSLTGLAFQMHETPPRTCDSSLGFCRPGTCVPQTTQRHFFGALSLQ